MKVTVSVPAAFPRVVFPPTVSAPVTSTAAPNFEPKSALIPPVVCIDAFVASAASAEVTTKVAVPV